VSQLPLLRALARWPETGSPGFRFVDVSSSLVFSSGTTAARLAGSSFRDSGSGCAFLDYDRDGWQDISFDQWDGLARPQAAAIHVAALSQQQGRDLCRRHFARRT